MWYLGIHLNWSDLMQTCVFPSPRLPWRGRWHQDHRQMQLPRPQPTDPAMRKRTWLPQHVAAKQLGLAGRLGLTRVDSGWLGLTSLKLGLWWLLWLVLVAVLAVCCSYLLIPVHNSEPSKRFPSWRDDLSGTSIVGKQLWTCMKCLNNKFRICSLRDINSQNYQNGHHLAVFFMICASQGRRVAPPQGPA